MRIPRIGRRCAMPRKRKAAARPPVPSMPSGRSAQGERLKEWRLRLTHARNLRTWWARRFRVEELEREYFGDLSYDDMRTEPEWFNLFFATIRTQMPGLFYQTPSFRATTTQSLGALGRRDAAVIEAVLKHIASEENNLEDDGKLALLQAYFRVGCLKVGYDPEMVANPQRGQPLYDEAMTAALGLQETIVEPDYVLEGETYTWDWVDARKLLFPDEGPQRRKWSWIAEEVEVTLEDAQADSRFAPNLRAQFVANAWVTDDFTEGQASRPLVARPDGEVEAEEQQRFRYTECWDRRAKRVYILADGQPFSDERFVLDEPFPDGIEDDPYALLMFLPIVGSPRPLPWPLPYTYHWLPVQRAYNTVRQQLTMAGNRSTRKVLHEPGTFTDSDEARKGLASNVDMEGVEVTNLQRPPMVLESPPLNADVVQSIQALQLDWRIITGATGQRMSGDDDGTTATSSALAEKAAMARDTDQQAAVVMWLGQAGTKMYQLVRQTLTLDVFVRMQGFGDKEFSEILASPGFQQIVTQLFGPEIAQHLPEVLPLYPGLQRMLREKLGAEHLLRVTREQLTAEAIITVIPTSLRARTLGAERSMWLQFLQVLGQAPQLMQSRGLLEETAAKFEFLSDTAIDELYLLAQQQAQQQQQMMQLKMQAELAKNAIQHPTGAAAMADLVGGQGQNSQLPPMTRQTL